MQVNNLSFDVLTNRNTFFEQMEKEVLELIDPETGRPFEYLVEETHCPVCGNLGNKYLVKWGFVYNKCVGCSLIFVNPRLTEQATLEMYQKGSEANEQWASSVNSSEHQKKFSVSYFKEQVDVLMQYKATGHLLDVGCGNGHFLSVAKNAGYDVQGVELEENAVRIARESGLKVRSLLLSESELNQERFDIITMFGVLEHLFEPARDVSIIHSMLNDNGVFVGITPNAQSLVGMLLKHDARFYTPRNHPMIFSFQSIRYLFESHGFKILQLDTVLSGYDSIINSLQNREPFGELSYDFLPPKFEDLIKNKTEFENLLLEWNLGLRLRIVAEKV